MIYTTGYTGKKIENLKPMLERLNAILIDIRYSPASRVPQWRFQTLHGLLGDSYHWLQSLGNRNYKSGGDIEIDDLDTGIRELKRLMRATEKSAVLFCGCKDFSFCHRQTIANALFKQNQISKELYTWTSPERYIVLFPAIIQ